MPALSFYYGNSKTYDPYIYTDGKGLTLTFDSITSEPSESFRKFRGRQ